MELGVDEESQSKPLREEAVETRSRTIHIRRSLLAVILRCLFSGTDDRLRTKAGGSVIYGHK